jgi:hypothetical protein
MENRDRDKLSRNSTSSTDAGNVNRDTSQRKGNLNDDSTAEFGQNIGRSENLNEPNQRGERVGSEGMRSDRGRGSSSSNIGSQESDISRNSDRDRSSNVERGRSGSSESEH